MQSYLKYKHKITNNFFIKDLKFLKKTLLIVMIILIVVFLFGFKKHGESKEIYNKHTVLFEELLTKGFKTKRLLVEQTQEKDVDILSNYLMDKNVTAMLDPALTEGFNSKSDAVKFLSDELSENNRFTFTIKLNSLQNPIGQITYTYYNEMLMLSFWIATEYQKNGYASEIILPLTKSIFEACKDIKTIYIACNYNNASSFKLSEKLCNFINKNGHYNLSKTEGYTTGEFENRTINLHYWEFILSKKTD